MRLQEYLVINTFLSSSLAFRLFASSFSGYITTLQVSDGGYGKTITPIFSNNGSAPQPTWLEEYKGVVYGANEAWGQPTASIAAYRKASTGELIKFNTVTSAAGPVSEVVHSNGKGLAIANYAGSAVQNLAILPDGSLLVRQTFKFTMSEPGPKPDRQDVPHPHQILTDPSGNFAASPDLGADLIRLFKIDRTTGVLAEAAPVVAPAGSGPRHGAFLKNAQGTFFYLLTELSNQVIAYKVTYGTNYESISFQVISTQSQFGPAGPPPSATSAAASECSVSPDKRFLITASRNAPFLNVTIPGLPAKIPSDTLQVWAIDQKTGKPTFQQLAPVGGVRPRHFSISEDGKLIAAGLQADGRVVLIDRNVETGRIGPVVAAIEGLGEVNCVVFEKLK